MGTDHQPSRIAASWSFFFLGFLAGALVATGALAVFLGGSRRTPAGAAGVAVTTLKLAHGLSPEHPVHLGMMHLREQLAELSGGRMRLDLYPSGQLGSETECLEQVQRGSLAMTKSSTAPLEGFIEEMKVFGLPYLFADEPHFWEVLDGEIGAELLAKGRSKNLLGLCYYDAGSRSFYTRTRMIETPADLKGLKIRVQNSPVAMKMVEALGGAPTPIAWGELYSALAQGTVDGAENNAPSYVFEKHCEVAPYYSLDAHTRVPDILLISAAVWDRLSSVEQGWLAEAAAASSQFQRRLWKQADTAALEEARTRFRAQVYEPDRRLFMDKVRPVYDELAKGAVGELVQRIRRLRQTPP
ncbi:MAG: TRAP transporter substrate-binding protein [Verrucomicrobia bacterium]|nr:TRAP transporter substrate-binding protein [Verrucomicrobiota bacterium]